MLIYGAGGHGRVVYDVMKRLGLNCEGFFDDSSNADLYGLEHYGAYNKNRYQNSELIIALGDNNLRAIISECVSHNFATLIDPSAVVANTAKVDKGTVVLHRAVVQAEVQIGKHVIINSSAVVDHDCSVGDFSHIAPNATLCGEVTVGKHCLIGAGAVVLPGAIVEDHTIVRAGSVVR